MVSDKMIMSAQSILLIFLASFAQAAPSAHRVTHLPGQHAPFRSAQYSGLVSLPAHKFEALWPVTVPAVSTHYWFSESERSARDPIIVWVQGGPGGSSIGGSLTELGPFRLDSRSVSTEAFKKTGVPTLMPNEFSYSTIAGVLAIEYADIGYSFCHDPKSCVWDDAKAVGAMLAFLNKFMGSLFPEHAGRELWIAGESYAGLLITGLSYSIMKQAKLLRLAGMLHGNGGIGHFCGCTTPWCMNKWPVGFCTGDLPADAKYHIEFFHRASLTSDDMYQHVKRACPDPDAPSEACSAAMKRMLGSMGDFTRKSWWNVYDIYDTCSDMPHTALMAGRTVQGGEHSAQWYCGGKAAATRWMNLKAVRAALHVSESRSKAWAMDNDLKWTCSNDDVHAVQSNFSKCPEGFITDYRGHLKQVVDAGYGVLVFSGDVDAQIPHTGTYAWTKSLGYTVKAPWQPWSSSTRVGFSATQHLVQGYVVQYSKHLSFATIKGAGHMVPKDRPAAIVLALQRYMHSRDLTRDAAPAQTGLAQWQFEALMEQQSEQDNQDTSDDS